MQVTKIKVGKTYPYVSRTVPASLGARGKVERVYQVTKGHYVELFDRDRNKSVTVRPSQVGPQL